MTISDLLQKYKIVMYPNFWPIIFFLFFFTFPLFYIWAPAPEELSARPWFLVHSDFYSIVFFLSNCLVTHLLQNIFFCVQHMKEINTGLWQHDTE